MAKKVCKRMFGIILSTVLALTSCPAVFPAFVTGRAAVEGNLLTDPNFEDPSAWTVVGAEGDQGETYATYTFEDGKAVFQMEEYGDIYWKPCIKTAQPITLEANSVYRAQFTVESTIARTVQGGFDNNATYSEKEALVYEGDSYKKTVTFDYTTGDQEENTFIVCLGDGMEEEQFQKHTVKVYDVSVTRVGDRPEDPDLGPLPEATKDVPEVEHNLLKNGNLATVDPAQNTAANWMLNSYLTNATVSVEPYRVNYDITGSQADYQINMNQDFEAEYHAEYTISFDVETTLARTVQYGIEKNGRVYTEQSQEIPAGQKTTVTNTYRSESKGSQNFMIYLGGNHPKHKVGISNISIVKTKDGEEKGYEPIEGFDEPSPTQAVDGNILPNGNFADGMTGWVSQYPGNVVNEKNRVDIKVTESNETYWVAGGLKTEAGIALQGGKKYRLRFTAVSTIDRSVYADIDAGGSPKVFGDGIELTANVPATFDQEITPENDVNGPFAIWFGGPTDLEVPHYIGLSDISLVAVDGGETEPGGGDDDEPVLETLPPATQDVPETENNLLLNGNLAAVDPEAKTADHWVLNSYLNNAELTVEPYRVDYKFTGMQADYEVNMNQEFRAEYKAEYKISFDVETTMKRTVSYGIEKNGRLYTKTSEPIPAGERTTVTDTYTAEQDGTQQFMIYLGGNYKNHEVGISNLSIVQTKEGEERGYQAIDAPGFGPEEPAATEPVDGNLLTNGNFAEGIQGWVSQVPDNLINRKNRVDIQVTAKDESYWSPGGLKTEAPITLVNGNTYRVKYTAVASVDRSIYADIDFGGSQKFFGEGMELTAGEPKTFNQEITMEETVTGPFVIWFGETTDLETPHYIGISDVSVVLVKEGEVTPPGPGPEENPLPKAEPRQPADEWEFR